VGGQLACDGDRDDRASLGSAFECVPALVEAPRGAVCFRADRGGLSLSPALERDARPERAPLVPSSLDEQPAGVAVARLRDRTETALLTG
jgi:hypothetical protein